MEIKLDSVRMWEAIIKQLWHYPQESWLVKCISNALNQQGLCVDKGGKIVCAKSEFEMEEGRFYVCTTTSGDDYVEGGIWKCVREAGELWLQRGICLRQPSKEYLNRIFRPATPEEISQKPDKDYQWSGKIGKKEPTGVLKEMLENLDEDKLAKTREEIMKESSDGELTEFEKELIGVCIDWAFTREGTVNGFAKEHSQKLMDVARKEFLSEFYHTLEHHDLSKVLESRYKARFEGFDDEDYRMWAAQDANVALGLARKQVLREALKSRSIDDYIAQVRNVRGAIPNSHQNFTWYVLTDLENDLNKLKGLCAE